MISRTLVLLIDSDRTQLDALSSYLRAENFETVETTDGLAGLREFFNVHPDFVVVDLGVREMPVWNVITRIRELSDTPIIVTGADATQDEMTRAFDLGAEGFLARPFAFKELLMRLNALQNRAPDGDDIKWVYKRNGLTVDLRSCEVFVHGKMVSLTGTEYRLLTYLIERRGWVLSHDQILSHVWGTDYIGEKDQVKLYVWYLRQKIENEPKTPKMIVTKRGLGYTFVG
jgi:two-component system KDP operon response regulator KdpE